ncbi:MAG: aminopeptidase P family protein [Gemmatimonadota bacterium]
MASAQLEPGAIDVIDGAVFAERRARLAERVGDGLILLPGNELSPMNYPENHYGFRQDGSFRYYFGLNLPGLVGTIDANSAEATLFGHEPTIDDIVWTGPQPSFRDLAASVGVGRTAPPGSLVDYLEAEVDAGRPLRFLPQYRSENRLTLESLLGIPAGEVSARADRGLMEAVLAQRLVKSDAEVAEIERAIGVSRDMHLLAMRTVRPGIWEREVAGRVRGEALAAGGDISFPIIFSVHGEVLHNHTWTNRMEDGDLVVHDSGAVTDTGYCSDITRTLPVSGRFDDRQRSVYEAVLGAQSAAIAAMKPGVPFRDVHLVAARELASAFTDIGLMRGDPAEAVEAGAHALFMPHGLGHMMGMDVHDGEAIDENLVGYGDGFERSTQFGLSALRLARPLVPGWVVTVEPGAYFIPELIRRWRSAGTCAEFIEFDELAAWERFGGIRIEDDVLVTDEAHRVLGPPIPKHPDDVETVMAEAADRRL